MSQLIDKLIKASRSTPPPIGFGAARTAPSPSRMVLVAAVEPSVTRDLSVLAGNTDALLLRPGEKLPAAKTVQGYIKTAPDLPWGVTAETEIASSLGEAIDFLLLAADSPVASVPADHKIGKILRVESSMDDGLLRAVNDLPVDAVLVDDSPEEGLVWHQLMIFRHLTGIIAKPVIIRAPVSVSPPELEALWKAGIDGLIVNAEGTDKEAWQELRTAIDRLPPREKPGQGKAEARLAYPTPESPSPLPQREDDDDDDEGF